MKKIFLIVFLILITSVVLQAAKAEIFAEDSSNQASPIKLGLGIDAAFTTVGMSQVNSSMDDIGDAAVYNGALDATKTHLGSGILGEVSFNIGFTAVPGLSIGPKIGYLYVFPGKLNIEYSDATWTWNANASLIPILVGVSYNPQLPNSGLILGGSLYFGAGLANADLKSSISIPGSSLSPSDKQYFDFDIPVSGSCFMTEIEADIGFAISQSSKLMFNLGYRIANVSEMDATQGALGTPLGDVHTGDASKNTNGDIMQYDFGGFILGAEFDLTF